MGDDPLPIVVVGGGGHAKVLLNVLQRLPALRVLGYVDPQDRGSLLGFPWLGNDDQLKELSSRNLTIAAAIGIAKVSADSPRLTLLRKLQDARFLLPPIVAPTALIASDVVLGDGTILFDGVVLQPGCRIGVACIVNTGATIDHDCSLGDDVHVAPGAAISGGVSIGDGSMIGVGACCIQGVRIAASCTIGAGSAVVSHCLEPGIYRGVPAKFVGP